MEVVDTAEGQTPALLPESPPLSPSRGAAQNAGGFKGSGSPEFAGFFPQAKHTVKAASSL